MHFPGYDAVDQKIVAFNMHTGGPMVFMVDCKVRTADTFVIATELVLTCFIKVLHIHVLNLAAKDP